MPYKNMDEFKHTLLSESRQSRDFPGGPVVDTLFSSAGGIGSFLGQGAKILYAVGPKNQNIKQKWIQVQ